MPDPNVFVSYSRVHERLVTPLVKLLRIGDRLVFQDVTSIELGQKWEQVLLDSLQRASFVVIIWCSHAESSAWVRNEIDVALKADKTIIPVCIDKTPLPVEIARFQGLDLSDDINHTNDQDKLFTRFNDTRTRSPIRRDTLQDVWEADLLASEVLRMLAKVGTDDTG